MATVREGAKPVLLVVDVQNGVMQAAWDAARVIENVSVVVDRARDAGVPVVWVQQSDEEFVRGSSEWEIVPALSPQDGEVRIEKSFNSSFEETPLAEELASLGATRVVLAGAATNWCVRATAYGALERGYDVTLVSDAHTTESMDLGDGKVIEASDIIDELNGTLTWVSYPGRTSSTATAKGADLA